MKTRWLIVSATVLGVALVAVPVFWRQVFPPPASTTADKPGDAGSRRAMAGVAPACDPKDKAKRANLDFTLKDLVGKDVKLADYKGKVLIVDFWATWCGPCKIEVPGFVEIQTNYKDKDFAILGIAVDDTVANLKNFAEQYKMNYPVLVAHDEVERAWGPIWGLPTTFTVSRDGTICKKHTGLATREQFEREVTSLF
jgi:thiol-disulfide isomerase/thioredoxin